MAEAYGAYRERVLGYLGDRDPIRVLQMTPSRLERLLKDVPRSSLRRRPARSSWSVIEIVAHMADAELALGWRVRNMLASNGCELTWFDEHAWSNKLGYSSANLRITLALFRTLRQSNLALLKTAGTRKWRSKYGVHAVRGRQTVWDFIQMEAAHDMAHLRQIGNAVGRK